MCGTVLGVGREQLGVPNAVLPPPPPCAPARVRITKHCGVDYNMFGQAGNSNAVFLRGGSYGIFCVSNSCEISPTIFRMLCEICDFEVQQNWLLFNCRYQAWLSICRSGMVEFKFES